jgi:hypothetical protein
MERKGPVSIEQQRHQKRLEKESLKKAGWESTGDTPYSLAQEIGRQNLFSHLASNLRSYVDEILATQSEEFVAANTKKSGNMTFISPELRKMVKEKVEEYASGKKPWGYKKRTESPE